MGGTKLTEGDAPPTVARVRRALGPAAPAWDALLDPERQRSTEWKRYGKKHPWSLRVNEGQRTVLWLVPEEGVLRVAVILGEKAVAKGLAGSLSQRDVPAYRSSWPERWPQYGERRGIQLTTNHRQCHWPSCQ